jgi:hypothetical protein
MCWLDGIPRFLFTNKHLRLLRRAGDVKKAMAQNIHLIHDRRSPPRLPQNVNIIFAEFRRVEPGFCVDSIEYPRRVARPKLVCCDVSLDSSFLPLSRYDLDTTIICANCSRQFLICVSSESRAAILASRSDTIGASFLLMSARSEYRI